MAIVQTLVALLGRSAGRILNAAFGWQTVYRQALQLGRAIEGRPQLLALAEDAAIERTGEASSDRRRFAS